MNKYLVCLAAALASTCLAVPAFSQDVAALATSPIIIAPPQTPLAQTIKMGLSTAYNDAGKATTGYDEAQKLYYFYGARHFEPIWLDEAANGSVTFSAPAQKILKLFESAASEGLRPQDYLTPDLNVAGVSNDANSMAALETAFSRAAMRYASDIYNGRVRPQSISEALDIQPKPLDESALLIQLASSADPVAVLTALEPTHAEFLTLKAALAKFDDNAAQGPIQIAPGATIKPGMSDPRVPALRTRFELPAAPDTVYDDALMSAVMAFQLSRNLDVDGVIGPATLIAINGGAAVTRADIIANMERWRWMPRDLGKFNVFVNIPEFRLAINRDGHEEYTTRVVVGSVKNQTPIFSDNIRHIVVNPYWNVPASIVKGEIAPAVLRNPNYIETHDYDLLYEGNPVSPWQVDWSQVSTNYFPFKIRQRPGASNALGQIKFLFPNKHDVYLHDTPSKSLFSRSFRAYSHGCVRVQNPMEFADALMANEPNISRASLEGMFGAAERWVNPEQQIPVHIAYFTVRVAADGSLQSFQDIYGHNAKLIAAMGLSAPAPAPEIIAEATPAANDLSP